jgi:hypothetical protein
MRIASSAASACHTSCSFSHDGSPHPIQEQFVNWLNSQPRASRYATVIWPKTGCPWLVRPRHLQSNMVDRLYVRHHLHALYAITCTLCTPSPARCSAAAAQPINHSINPTKACAS